MSRQRGHATHRASAFLSRLSDPRVPQFITPQSKFQSRSLQQFRALRNRATVAIRGNKKYDIDFTGGTLVHLHLDNSTPPGFIRSALAETGYGEAEVQSIWSGENLTQFASTANEFGIRIKELGDEKVKEKLTHDVRSVLDEKDLFEGIDFIETLVFRLKLIF